MRLFGHFHAEGTQPVIGSDRSRRIVWIAEVNQFDFFRHLILHATQVKSEVLIEGYAVDGDRHGFCIAEKGEIGRVRRDDLATFQSCEQAGHAENLRRTGGDEDVVGCQADLLS